MERNQEVAATAARTSLELVRFAVERDNKMQRSQVGDVRGAKALNVFDPAHVFGKALAGLLSASADGCAVSADDIADSLRLLALKLRTGDSAYVLASLAGQAALLERLMTTAASEMDSTNRLDMKSARVKNFLSLQRAHMRVLAAIASLQARVAH